MNITENKKAIIDEIAKGTVFDFLSFVKVFYNDNIFEYDFKTIQEKKKSDFDPQKI